MAQEKPNRLAEWVLIVRRGAPLLRERLDDWLEAVREEPRLLYQTSAARYAGYALIGTVLLWGVTRIPAMIVPPPSPDAQARANSADFHVVCSGESCAYHFVIHKEFGFRRFPVPCPACGGETGRRARRCNAARCRGRWVAPTISDGTLACPRCRSHFD